MSSLLSKMNEQNKTLEKLCKTNSVEVIKLIDEGIDPSYKCLLYSCKVNSNSNNIIKLIDRGILPDKRCLLNCCNTKNNSYAIIKILNFGIKPTYDCFKYKKIYLNENYKAFVELSGKLIVSYNELKFACSIYGSDKSINYMVNVVKIKPDSKCVLKLCKYNYKDYKSLKILLNSGVKVKLEHIFTLNSHFDKKWRFNSIILCMYHYAKQNKKIKKQNDDVRIPIGEIERFIKLFVKNNIDLDKIID